MKPFAWCGWSLHVPDDWDMIRETGTTAKGSLRLADEETVRLDMRWEQPRTWPPPAPPSLQSGAGVKRRRGDTVIEHAVPWLAETPLVADHCLLQKPSGGTVVQALAQTSEQRRFALLELPVDAENAPSRATTKGVLMSLRAPAPDKTWRYQLYDLHAAVPGRWPLVHRSLDAGRKRLVFATPAGNLHLWALHLARQRSAPPAQWLRAFIRSVYPQIKGETEEDGANVVVHATTRAGVFRRRSLHAGGHRHWTGRLLRRLEDNTDYLLMFAHAPKTTSLPWDSIRVGSVEVKTTNLA